MDSSWLNHFNTTKSFQHVWSKPQVSEKISCKRTKRASERQSKEQLQRGRAQTGVQWHAATAISPLPCGAEQRASFLRRCPGTHETTPFFSHCTLPPATEFTALDFFFHILFLLIPRSRNHTLTFRASNTHFPEAEGIEEQAHKGTADNSTKMQNS